MDVTGIERDGKLWRVGTSNGDILSKATIIATGADYNKLGIPGEERLTGRGVSYCATCDAAFFKDQEVAVIGGGDAAMDEGLFTSRYASKVYVIHRRNELRASRVLQERAFANSKMQFIWNTVTEEVVGEADVSGVRVRNLRKRRESSTARQGRVRLHRPSSEHVLSPGRPPSHGQGWPYNRQRMDGDELRRALCCR